MIFAFWPFGSRAGDKEWKSAEALLRHDGVAGKIYPQKHLPYTFMVREGTSNVYRVVHHGKLLPRDGLATVVAYLRDIDAFKIADFDRSDLLELLDSFKAMPPSSNPSYWTGKELNPEFSRGENEIKLVLYFFVPDNQYRPGVTPPAPPPTKDVEKFTLVIDRTHSAAWTKEVFQVDRNKQFY